MRRAVEVKSAGTWQGGNGGVVTLAFEDRHRRRIRMTDDNGEAFLLDLAHPVLLAGGDGLVLEDGGVIAVQAAHEAVIDIVCRDPAQTARIAWHIGNRHTAVQVLNGLTLRILDDHVLGHMVEGLGGRVTKRTAAFEPEPGAYAEGHGHGH